MNKYEKKLAARGKKVLEAEAAPASERANRVVRIYYISAGDSLVYVETGLVTWQAADSLVSGLRSKSSFAYAVQSFNPSDELECAKNPVLKYKGSGMAARFVVLPSQNPIYAGASADEVLNMALAF